MYLLDTNVCIHLLNKSGSSQFIQKFVVRSPTDFRLCSIVKSELYFGAYRGSRRSQNLEKLVRFFQQFFFFSLVIKTLIHNAGYSILLRKARLF